MSTTQLPARPRPTPIPNQNASSSSSRRITRASSSARSGLSLPSSSSVNSAPAPLVPGTSGPASRRDTTASPSTRPTDLGQTSPRLRNRDGTRSASGSVAGSSRESKRGRIVSAGGRRAPSRAPTVARAVRNSRAASRLLMRPSNGGDLGDGSEHDFKPEASPSLSPAPSTDSSTRWTADSGSRLPTRGAGIRLNGLPAAPASSLLDLLDAATTPRPIPRSVMPPRAASSPRNPPTLAPFPLAEDASEGANARNVSSRSSSPLSTLSDSTSVDRPLARGPRAPTTEGLATGEAGSGDATREQAEQVERAEKEERKTQRFTAAEKGKGRAGLGPQGEEPIVVGGSSSEEDVDGSSGAGVQADENKGEGERPGKVKKRKVGEVGGDSEGDGEEGEVEVIGWRIAVTQEGKTAEGGDEGATELDEDSLLSAYNCPICFCQPEKAVLTDCGHIMCGKCLLDSMLAAIRRNPYIHPSAAVNSASTRSLASRGTRGRGRRVRRGGGVVPHSAPPNAHAGVSDPLASAIFPSHPARLPMPPPPPAYPEEWTAALLQQAWHAVLSAAYDRRLQLAGLPRETWAVVRAEDGGAPPAEGRWDEVRVAESGRGLWELEGYAFMREERGRVAKGAGAGAESRRWVIEGDCPVCRKQIPGGFGPEGLGGVKGLKVMVTGL